jgi:helix-turn-helix protein
VISLLSPIELSHLQAFCYWLRMRGLGWKISLPEDEPVEAGKDYPPFHLFRNGVDVCTVESPAEVLERIGDEKLTQEYERLVSEDPDSLVA